MNILHTGKRQLEIGLHFRQIDSSCRRMFLEQTKAKTIQRFSAARPLIPNRVLQDRQKKLNRTKNRRRKQPLTRLLLISSAQTYHRPIGALPGRTGRTGLPERLFRPGHRRFRDEHESHFVEIELLRRDGRHDGLELSLLYTILRRPAPEPQSSPNNPPIT